MLFGIHPTRWNSIAAGLLALGCALSPSTVVGQERPAKRLASIVSVAVDEYRKAFDARGQLVSRVEYDEAQSFLGEARLVAAAIPGRSAEAAALVIDSMVTAVAQRASPARLVALHRRFSKVLGAQGALDRPRLPLDQHQGRTLYAATCSSCHGQRGLGDGPLANKLSVAPPPIGSSRLAAGLSAEAAYNIVSVGVSGTPMPAFSGLTPQQRWNVIDYVFHMRGEPAAVAQLAAEPTVSPLAQLDNVGDLLDSALFAARTNRIGESRDRAFDAYIAFEPVERLLQAREPARVADIEAHFASFRSAVAAADVTAAEQWRQTLASDLAALTTMVDTPSSAWSAAVHSFLIIIREGFEAILIVGAVVALLIRTGNKRKLRAVWAGVAGALAATVLLLIVMRSTLSALPATGTIVEGATLLVAAGVLFSVSYWLISKVESAKWQAFLKQQVSRALDQGGGKALALVAFLAVFREGAETVLFFQALAADAPGAGFSLVGGILAGTLVLAVAFGLFYKLGIRIPLRPFFAVTSVLLYYMAFVFTGKGIRELQEGNVIPITTLRFPRIELLGVYPSVETLLAQLLLVGLFIFALLRTWLKPVRTSK